MRLATVRVEGEQRIAAVINDEYIDLNKACELLFESKGQARAKQIAEAYIPPNMIGFLQGGEDSTNLAKESIEYVQNNDFSDDVKRKLYYEGKQVKLESPIQKPEKIICVGLNYREHIEEMGRELPTIPVVFAKYNNTIIAPGDPILKPKVSDALDHEAELVVVIGKKGKYISEEEAMDYVAGYTVGNEATIRDFQKRTKEWLQGKTFDTTLPLGPHLVTKESLPNPDNCDLVLTLNGEERQRSNTKNLVFTIPYLVNFLSNIMTLEVGDIICTGTPGGVGQARKPQSWMKHGDVVRVEIEGIGALENPIVNE
ncbi:fumarylacetoacetate hydrolase family protein [Neobacillus drentensis]|uniref:fumarylacetoacetate hydrolase family protein n=1 Tax=Neobacillus drentensis TaxID=220684 RepID=UPI0028620ECF|nr:fumarylacetoacetate hydrolase family protein [Neobacillus drentensis]MDR7236389.1 acylpyruvate hydrolase [Neobacillus drentensis]